MHLSPARGGDGRVHPADEHAVAEAIRFAAASGLRLRIRGAGHAPPGTAAGDLVLSLDRMRDLRVLDEDKRLVQAQAGVHLGRDPSAPAQEGRLAASLLHRLADEHRWTLGSTGGITHQTLGGFLATASAGGSLQHSLLDQVVEVRLIDGRGELQVFSGKDGARGLPAVLPSLGLLGVITAVTLRCEPLFTIAGQEAIVDLAAAEMDLEGPGDAQRPSLASFLARAEYARIEWWPQRGAERLIVWQAQRTEVQPGFRPTRYEEFTRYPLLGEALFSLLFVIFGNLRHPARVRSCCGATPITSPPRSTAWRTRDGSPRGGGGSSGCSRGCCERSAVARTAAGRPRPAAARLPAVARPRRARPRTAAGRAQAGHATR